MSTKISKIPREEAVEAIFSKIIQKVSGKILTFADEIIFTDTS